MIPRSSRSNLALALLLLAAVVSSTPARAQCSTQWLPSGASFPGADARVWASCRWDPDGPGPLQPVVVIAGEFVTIGPVVANYIAAFDPASGAWSTFGTGMDAPVLSLTTLPNGDLVAGGMFSVAGGVSADSIARWNGTSWSAMGPGMNSQVRCLTTLPNGDVVAGGTFASFGGVSANCVARWDGTSWSPLGSGITGGIPYSFWPLVATLTTLPNGDLVAGGNFTDAGGVSANGIARWNGTAWSALGSGISSYAGTDPIVNAIVALPNGDLVAGGTFQLAGGAFVGNIARWDGATWSALGAGIGGSGSYRNVNALAVLPNGDLLAGGDFTIASGASANCVARWNGASWSALGAGVSGPFGGTFVRALTTLPNGDVIAGGEFRMAGAAIARQLARWDGTLWSGLVSGAPSSFSDPVYALTTLRNGDLVASGPFTVAGGAGASCIARWNGTTWAPLGSGMPSGYRVLSLTTLPNGDLVAGGNFLAAGGVSAYRIARWNGTSWSALGSGITGDGVWALTTMPNGDVVAGGSFSGAGGVNASCIARWNGASWSALGTGVTGGYLGHLVACLTTLPNGEIVAGGNFAIAGGVSANSIARWNGAAWSAMGSGVDGQVYALTTLPNGDLVAGGNFVTAGGVSANHIARWDGAS